MARTRTSADAFTTEAVEVSVRMSVSNGPSFTSRVCTMSLWARKDDLSEKKLQDWLTTENSPGFVGRLGSGHDDLRFVLEVHTDAVDVDSDFLIAEVNQNRISRLAA